jgi:membrane-associated protease RseP (regulator of RpoE activity)
MSDNRQDYKPELSKIPLPSSFVARTVDPGAQEAMRRAAEQVMAVQDVTLGDAANPIRLRGRLIVPSDEAFAILRPQFEAVEHTPMLRREEGLDVIMALPVVFGQQKQGVPWVAILLLVATLLSVLSVGVQGELYVPWLPALLAEITGSAGDLFGNLNPTAADWRNAIVTGILYTLSLVGILGVHEMGHYLMARRNKVHTTLPFFIPLPFGFLGTLGAVIAMREPAANRRVQFDIGVAGPLAGLIVAVPVLLIGLALSEVTTTADILNSTPEGVSTSILHEGQSLAYLALKYITFGQILPRGDLDVWIHPVAFAGWAGLLVTALNLLPLGQLDGGHVIYGLFGDKAQKVRGPVIAALVVMAFFGSIREIAPGMPPGSTPTGTVINFLAGLPVPGWSGWWIWILLSTLMLRSHAPVLDEITELDGKRRALGVIMLIIFILIFTPTPMVIDAEPVAALLRLFV